MEVLRRDGLARGLSLASGVETEIRAFAESEPCAPMRGGPSFLPGDFRRIQQANGGGVIVGHYFEAVEQCPAVTRLRADPTLTAIAAGYLGRGARPVSTRLWWSFPSDHVAEQDLHSASQERFHFDVDDWRTAKAFFYLTDVDPSHGAHTYVRRSHGAKPLRHEATLLVGKDADDIERVYGRDKITVVTGPAGTGFFIDPFGFHMGTLAQAGPRLMLEIGFGVSSVNARRFHG